MVRSKENDTYRPMQAELIKVHQLGKDRASQTVRCPPQGEQMVLSGGGGGHRHENFL
jgi:hypothetical protein